jgi:hypothetical protein
MHQAHHSGLTFDEGADRREVVVTDDEIALPVSGLGAVVDREWAVVDRQHRLLEPQSAALPTLVRATVIPARAQRRPKADTTTALMTESPVSGKNR